MTEADSIIRDPNVAVKFERQIFPPKVQQSMVGRADYEVFRESVHGAVKGLHISYEIGMLFFQLGLPLLELGSKLRGIGMLSL